MKEENIELRSTPLEQSREEFLKQEEEFAQQILEHMKTKHLTVKRLTDKDKVKPVKAVHVVNWNRLELLKYHLYWKHIWSLVTAAKVGRFKGRFKNKVSKKLWRIVENLTWSKFGQAQEYTHSYYNHYGPYASDVDEWESEWLKHNPAVTRGEVVSIFKRYLNMANGFKFTTEEVMMILEEAENGNYTWETDMDTIDVWGVRQVVEHHDVCPMIEEEGEPIDLES